MARASSTGLQFLIRRPDTGKYAYHRELAADLAPFLEGELVLPWTNGTHVLKAQRTVKVSLKTGDDAMARVRWTRIHEQVEGLVQMARVLANSQAEKLRSQQGIDRLPPGTVATIAAQARHDMLSEHDQTWIDPTFTSPLTSVVVNLMRKAGHAGHDMVENSRRFAHDLLQRQVDHALASRAPGLLDKTIQVSELRADNLFDIEALKSGHITHLRPEQIDAIQNAPTTSTIPGEVETRLAENGFDLPAGHPDRRALALSLLRSQHTGLRDIRARDKGAAIETPARPLVVSPAASKPAPAKPALSDMRERWIKIKRPKRKQVDDNALYTTYFISEFGDLPVDQITKPILAVFLDLLGQCPRNVPHSIRRASLRARVEWGNQAENILKPKLTRPTINAKGLGSLSAAMDQAVKLGHIAVNPCVGMGLDVGEKDRIKRTAYSLEDLTRIFATSVYVRPVGNATKSCDVVDYWLPLLGLFSGARLEELGQLLIGDIKLANGISYLHITDVADDEERTSDHEKQNDAPSKSVKSLAGRRVVPIHHELVRCGFLAFVEERRRAGFSRLFPELKHYRDRVTKEWSKKWARHTDQKVTDCRSKTFHSFRHLFIGTLRGANVDKDIIKALVGHANHDVTIGYGQVDGAAFPLTVLNDALQRFQSSILIFPICIRINQA